MTGLALCASLLLAPAVWAGDAKLAGTPQKGREASLKTRPAAIAAVSLDSTEDHSSATTLNTGDQTVRVDLGGGGAARTLALPRGKSAVIELPVEAKDVLVSDPKVAEVVLSTPRRIYVLGQSSGQTDAVFFDGAGRQLLRLDIRVDQNVASVTQTLNRLLPGTGIKAESINDNVILTGQAPDAATADQAVRIAQTLVAKPDNLINMMSIASREQVMLKVRIVEVDRTVIKQLGFNLSELIGQTGKNQYLLGVSPTYGINGALLGGITGGYKLDTQIQPEIQVPCTGAGWAQGTLCPVVVHGTANGTNIATPQTVAGSNGVNQAKAQIQAFERAGLVRTLAEPNLTAISGESAKFLAGGEFPVPVGQDSTGRVTIEFKQYGVGLGFTPVVLSKGRISLKVSTEVSEISNTGAFSVSSGTGSTLVIPGLTVRRVETTVELPSGGAMMLAGLMQNTTKQNLDSLPGLMELPVLGALFRSRDFLNNQSELVVIVTPYIVKATSPDQLATPADGLVIANDMETNLLGRLNRSLAKTAATDAAAKSYQGPYGYVVE